MCTLVYLDSNIILHYPPVNQIDWLAISETPAVELVATPIFLSELDKYKYHRRYGKRVKRFTHLLEEIVDKRRKNEVRSGVFLLFRSDRPTASVYEDNALQADIPDQQLIACAIQGALDTGRPAMVATNDVEARIFALQADGIDLLTLPEEIRLQDEPDQLEVENRKLKQMLEEASNRTAILDLCFADHEHHKKWIIAEIEDEEAFVTKKLYEIKTKYPLLSETEGLSVVTSTRLSDMSAIFADNIMFTPGMPRRRKRPRTRKEVISYNQELIDYFEECERWLRYRHEANARQRLRFKVDLEVVNEGRITASEIEMRLLLPEGITVWDENDLPPQIEQPKAPHKPGTTKVVGALRDLSSIIRNFGAPTSPTQLTTVENEGRHVRFWTRHIKPLYRKQLRTFYIVFGDEKEVTNFQCKYTIHAVELEAPTTGDLHFVFATGAEE